MKKIFALVLAAVMTAGMTTVAFAWPDGTTGSSSGHNDFANNDAWDQIIVPEVTDDLYVINEDGEVNTTDDVITSNTILEGGDEIAIPVELFEYWEDKDDNKQYDATHDFSVMYEQKNDFDFDDDLDVWTDWRVNQADVGTRFVKVDGDRIMCVIVTVPENDSEKIEDLVGTIKVGTTRTKAKASNASAEVDVKFGPDGTNEYYKANFDGDETLEAGATGIVDFDTDAGVIDIEFGDQALFTVDVTGQSKLNLAWNTKFDKEIADRDQSANMDFITFEGKPAFNKTGTFYLYAEDDTGFVYEVVDGQVKTLDAKYNEDYEAWEFKTRTLGEYILSDKELDLDAVNTVEDETDASSSTTDGDDKPNPDTGR